MGVIINGWLHHPRHKWLKDLLTLFLCWVIIILNWLIWHCTVEVFTKDDYVRRYSMSLETIVCLLALSVDTKEQKTFSTFKIYSTNQLTNHQSSVVKILRLKPLMRLKNNRKDGEEAPLGRWEQTSNRIRALLFRVLNMINVLCVSSTTHQISSAPLKMYS